MKATENNVRTGLIRYESYTITRLLSHKLLTYWTSKYRIESYVNNLVITILILLDDERTYDTVSSSIANKQEQELIDDCFYEQHPYYR